MENLSEFYLTTPSKILANLAQDWLTSAISESPLLRSASTFPAVPAVHDTSDNDKLVVTSKWIYKIKHTVDGSIDKYKARFVTRGFSQKEGIYYE